MTRVKMTNNFLTFDIEEWFHANYSSVNISKYSHLPTTLPNLVDILIHEMDEVGVKSTCFIVGNVAKKYPQIVKKLHKAGHEIASHSMHHKLMYSLKPSEFVQDTYESCETLQSLTGTKVLGYRAPSWSVKENMLGWFYDGLRKNGIEYSSSVFPAANYLYGIDDVTPFPHVVEGGSGCIEIPCSVGSILNKKFGFSGGFYFRVFPKWFIKTFAHSLNDKGIPVVFYLHPREIDVQQEKLDLPLHENLIHYWNIAGTLPKLREVMRLYKKSFTRMDTFFGTV